MKFVKTEVAVMGALEKSVYKRLYYFQAAAKTGGAGHANACLRLAELHAPGSSNQVGE